MNRRSLTYGLIALVLAALLGVKLWYLRPNGESLVIVLPSPSMSGSCFTGHWANLERSTFTGSFTHIKPKVKFDQINIRFDHSGDPVYRRLNTSGDAVTIQLIPTATGGWLDVREEWRIGSIVYKSRHHRVDL